MAALDTIDAIVFTGGIGENSAEVRALTTAHLKIIGVVLDADRNSAASGTISADESRIACLVIPTDDERMIARETARFIS